MNRMVEIEQDREKPLNHFELGNELYTLVENNIIPVFIAEKIKEKVKNADVRLTKSQLSDLINIAKKEIQTQKISYDSFSPKKTSEDIPVAAPEEYSESEDPVVDNIFRSIDGLGKRISRIEDTKLDYPGESAGKMVTAEDIQLPNRLYPKTTKTTVIPLLEIPNDPERVVVLMKWLQFLVDKVGKDNLTDILEYYVDIGWISEKIVMNLIEYSEGITEEKEPREFTGNNDLQAKDHIQSLLFIQQLKGQQPDSYFLHRIERRINKMTKNLNTEKYKSTTP